jgi:hypothetical protein
MSKTIFKQDNFVMTLDPESVFHVSSSTTSYFFKHLGGCEVIDFNKYPELAEEIMSKVVETFEVVDFTDNHKPTPDVIYSMETFGLATWFKLKFPSQCECDFAAELLEYETQLKLKPWDKELYCLNVNFAPFYSNFEENRQLLIDILGEPQD